MTKQILTALVLIGIGAIVINQYREVRKKNKIKEVKK